MNIPLLKKNLRAEGGGTLRPAKKKDLQLAEAMGYPQVILDFYAQHEPSGECVEVEQRIWSIRQAVKDTKERVPGYLIHEHGFVVFGSTLCSDAYCFDLKRKAKSGEPLIVLIPHDAFFGPVSRQRVLKNSKVVAESFSNFIDLFATRCLDDEPHYHHD